MSPYGVNLRRGGEIAAVYKRRAVALAAVFVGIMRAEYYKRIGAVTGYSLHALANGFPAFNRSTVGYSFHCDLTLKSDKIVIRLGKIKTKA